MQKKLTITIAPEVYEGLHRVVGPRRISHFIEELVRPHVTLDALDEYRKMAADEAAEEEALEWSNALIGDAADEPR